MDLIMTLVLFFSCEVGIWPQKKKNLKKDKKEERNQIHICIRIHITYLEMVVRVREGRMKLVVGFTDLLRKSLKAQKWFRQELVMFLH